MRNAHNTPSKRSRQRAFKRGVLAEYWCAFALLLKGYSILAMRYKTKLGEVDIIAKHRGALIFIEVKARPTLAQGLEAITPQSQQRIAAAASLYVQKNPAYAGLSMRFDVMISTKKRWPHHQVNAFDAGS